MDIEIIREALAWSTYQQAGERLDYLLPPFTILDLTDCIIMELIKSLFDASMPKKSLRAHLQEAGMLDNKGADASRMRFSRLVNYAQYFRTAQMNVIAAERGVLIPELLPDDVSSMSGKLDGHQLSDMQFFELQMIDRLPLIKKIANRRIFDTQKITHKKLRGFLAEYANIVEDLKRSAASDEKSYVFNTFALYTLEWKYSIDLAYAAICASEAIPKSDPFDAVKLLAGRVSVPTKIGVIHTDNRFILHRKELVPEALEKSTAETTTRKTLLYLRLKDEAVEGTICGRPALDFMRTETKLEDWAEFIRRHYRLLETHADYDWTNARLRSYRQLTERLMENIPPPRSPPKKKKTAKK